MKITEVEAIWLRVPAIGEFIEWSEDAFVVRVHTDSGLFGVGEADSAPAVMKAIVEMPASHSICRGLREILIGENPLDTERLWRKMIDETAYVGPRGAVIHAISAIDIALWDLAGKHYGVPCYQLLGGKERDEIDAYETFIPDEEPEKNRRIVERLLESGLRQLKIGGGIFGLDPERDRKIVKEVRSAAGPDVPLAIDLLCRWKNFRYAQQQAEALAEFDLAWIEEPIQPDDHIGLRRLSEVISTPISGGERLATSGEFDAFMQATHPGIIQPDITRCGGISEMRRIYDLAVRCSTQLVPHGYSTGILLAATSQFLASVPGGSLIEYSRSNSPLATSLVTNHLPLEGGKVRVGELPGLGVTLDESLIERYRIDVAFGHRHQSSAASPS